MNQLTLEILKKVDEKKEPNKALEEIFKLGRKDEAKIYGSLINPGNFQLIENLPAEKAEIHKGLIYYIATHIINCKEFSPTNPEIEFQSAIHSLKNLLDYKKDHQEKILGGHLIGSLELIKKFPKAPQTTGEKVILYTLENFGGWQRKIWGYQIDWQRFKEVIEYLWDLSKNNNNKKLAKIIQEASFFEVALLR